MQGRSLLRTGGRLCKESVPNVVQQYSELGRLVSSSQAYIIVIHYGMSDCLSVIKKEVS